MIFRRGLSGSARNEVAGQLINAATRAQYLVSYYYYNFHNKINYI